MSDHWVDVGGKDVRAGCEWSFHSVWRGNKLILRLRQELASMGPAQADIAD